MEITIIDRSKAIKDFICDLNVDYAMIIDDVEEDIYVLEKMIERHYFSKHLIKCSNSIDALAYLQKNMLNSELLPEVIFLDLAMPELSGEEFLEHYEKLPPAIRQRCSLYVYSSSKKDEDIYQNGVHPLVAGFVPKPISLIFLFGVSSDHEQRHYPERWKSRRQPA